MSLKRDPIVGPYKGIIRDLPPPVPPEAFDDVLNFLCRKGRLQTRPRLNVFEAPPDGAIVRDILTFQDAVNAFHTLVLTTQNPYFLTSGPTYNLLTYPGGITSLDGTALPYGLANLINRVYFSNGSVPVLYADGESSVKVAGNVPGAARFMTELAGHLVLAHTTEPAPGTVGSTVYPRRVRWSKSGNPDDWTDFTAGFADLLEVPDELTGIATIGRNGYLFRPHGFSVMYPTGIGMRPFGIEHYSYGLKGIGNAYPYSLAVYGDTVIFVASDDIYALSLAGLRPIGLGAKKGIFKDLGNASGDQVTSFITPTLGKGYDFLSYWLSIPGVNVTWIYNYDEGSWVRFNSSSGRLTAFNAVTVS